MAPSFAYNFFNISQNGSYISCKLCREEIQCRKMGSRLHTSPMVRHLRRKHSEAISKSPNSHHSGFATPITSTLVDKERGLNVSFNSQAVQGNGDSLESCSRESLPVRVEKPTISLFSDSEVSPATISDSSSDANVELLRYVQHLMIDVSSNMDRLTHLEAVQSKYLEDDGVDVCEEDNNKQKSIKDDYKKKIITVNGFSFEDYPH